MLRERTNDTEREYKEIIDECRALFEKKTKDYGTAWRILRLPSITDQIFIKAQRIRSIQEKGTQKVDDDIRGEFIGIINYSIIALMQIGLDKDAPMEMPVDSVMNAYGIAVDSTWILLTAKNHDYGEAWRDMRISSITDIILQKLLRVKQIEDNSGRTMVSEGVDANYRDMINYAVFCLIKMKNDNVMTTMNWNGENCYDWDGEKLRVVAKYPPEPAGPAPIPKDEINKFIAAIERMLKKEEEHLEMLQKHQNLHVLVEGHSVVTMIERSKFMVEHFTIRLKEYKEYATKHYGE